MIGAAVAPHTLASKARKKSPTRTRGAVGSLAGAWGCAAVGEKAFRHRGDRGRPGGQASI